MPQLTIACPKGQGETGVKERVGWNWPDEWMERGKGDKELERRYQEEMQRSTQLSTNGQPRHRAWFQARRAGQSWRGWYSLALGGVVWSVCQVEAPLHPSLCQMQVCWRLLLVGMLWMGLGSCVLGLRYCLRLRERSGVPPQMIRQEVVAQHTTNQYSRLSRERTSDHHVPLAHALTDSLLLCVLQEPVSDPSLAHIQALLSRLESVSHALERADILSEAWLEAVNQRGGDLILIDKVKHISAYLQQRTRSLRRLLQVQGEFEASVTDVLEGLERLWARLEELHTGVTLTKDWSRGQGDLSAAETDTESLSTVLGQYRSRLQCCQTHLKDSTQLLQELTWSHTHISHSVSSSTEAVWPELLLQSNIEQFDKVLESFLSSEQQTSTFQAHLRGLGGTQEGQAGPLTHTKPSTLNPCSSPVSPLSPPRQCSAADVPPRHQVPSPPPLPVLSADTDTGLTLCERSALHFSTAIGRLRGSRKKK